tara:strand:+ start:2343 stop:2660 length:318 start_codon:yes stop_codon:yes gene_type:complete
METQSKYPFIVEEQTIKNIIHAAVHNSVKDLIKKSKIEKPVQLKEAAAFFGMSTLSLMKKVHSGEIKAHRYKGKRSPYYFYLSHMEEVLKEGTVKTINDVLNDFE